MPHVIYKTTLSAPIDEVFAWHCTDDALPGMIPPWEPVVVESVTGRLPEKGSTVVMRLNLVPFIPLYWVANHTEFVNNSHFVDIQERGPFAAWQHTHRFIDNGNATTTLEDDITYRVPLGWLGELFGGWFVRYKLNRMFAYRHQQLEQRFGKAD